MDSKDIMNLIPLDEDTTKLANDIMGEKDIDKVKNLTHMFNLNQAKKDVIRILKLNNLVDKVQDQMIERFEKRPGEFSNNELLNYMQVCQAAIDRANKSLALVDETPAITMNQINVTVKEDPILDKNSRDKVTDAVRAIMQKLKLQQDEKQEDVIEIKEDETEVGESNNQPIVSLNDEEGDE